MHDRVSETVEESLRALQLGMASCRSTTRQTPFLTPNYSLKEYIDLLLLHGGHPEKEKRLSMYKELIELKEAGKIVSFGVSNLFVVPSYQHFRS